VERENLVFTHHAQRFTLHEVDMSTSPARQPWWRRWFGTRSERAAARYLRRQGFRILRRNYSCSSGEIDLIALDGRCLVFVEVRSTGNDDPERPAASVNHEKQTRLTRAALHFLSEHRLLGQAARFDVLTLTWPAGLREPQIEHYRQAFEAAGRGQMFS
jgi:putative endonuclease